MGQLVSVNVGLPRDIMWRGETVRTGIWKKPTSVRVMVRRLNVTGDGQGDLAGHGGEHRAVMVCQTVSYAHWETELGRRDSLLGSSARTSPCRDWPKIRGASAIAIGSARHSSRSPSLA
jgi:MOSC domain-containing protein YiiM